VAQAQGKSRYLRARIYVFACVARIVIMHHFSSASAGRSSALLITIQADWAKRDETGHTGATTARQNKGWMARRGAGGPGTYTTRAICGAKNESANRRCGKRAVWCEGEKEYETEQLKLGTVPACAYNIRQKFVNASRDLLAVSRPARLV